MRKRKLLLLSLFPSLLVALLIWTILRTPEPQYEGKPLSAWLYTWAYSPTLSEKEKAKQATLQIGTNALPFLLQYLQYTPPRWKTTITTALTKLKTIPLVGRMIPYSVTTDVAAVRAETAVYAFEALGQTGAYVYPDLARLACDASAPGPSERAISVLIMRRSCATNALGFVLSNAPPQIRLKTIHMISAARDQRLLRALWPALNERLHDDDDEVARWAVSALLELKHSQPNETLTLFIECLSNPKPKVRAEAIRCIATFDMAATPAVPSLIPFLSDTDWTVRKEATNILRMIAPEALTNAASK